LKRVGSFVDVRDLASTPVPATERVFVLSFDDGYSDFVQHALPVIKSHGIPSNLNIVAESTLTGLPIWSARLYDALSRLECWDLDVVDGLLPAAWSIAGSGSLEHIGFTISNHIRQLPVDERIAVIEKIEEAGRPNLDPVRALTIKEISALPGSVHVGAHGGTHESMALVSVSEFEMDFEMCRDLFENHLGRPLVTYAFPLGGYRIEHLDFLRAAGVEQILLVGERTTKGGVPVLPRLTIGGRLRGQFLAKSVGVAKRPADV
jgi:peptidoglycan/xylan/chitin deacetylase (PgdA/CDA1 family)